MMIIFYIKKFFDDQKRYFFRHLELICINDSSSVLHKYLKRYIININSLCKYVLVFFQLNNKNINIYIIKTYESLLICN